MRRIGPERGVEASQTRRGSPGELRSSSGRRVGKARPALIVQNDITNRHSPITIVVAVTSRFDDPLYPAEVLIVPPEGGWTAESVALLNQLRSVDRQRLVRRMGRLTARSMSRIDRALRLSLGLVRT